MSTQAQQDLERAIDEAKSLDSQFELKAKIHQLLMDHYFEDQNPMLMNESDPEKAEASIIFDEIIDRDDVSGWIDRDNYFTLSLFNVSLEKNNFSGNDYKYPLLSVEMIMSFFFDR